MSRHTITTGILGIALAGAVGLVITLASQEHDLADAAHDMARLATRAHAGMYVPTYEATSLMGAPITLADVEPARKQLLYFFTTTCPFCSATLPTWKELAKDAKAVGVNVIGVSLDSLHLTQAYRAEHRLSFPIVLMDDQRYMAMYRANQVPLTMLVDETGRVSLARAGELTDPAAIDSVRNALVAPRSSNKTGGSTAIATNRIPG